MRFSYIRSLAELPVGPAGTAISREELRELVGEDASHSAPNQVLPSQIAEIDIEIQPPPRVRQQASESEVPVGLAGLAWGVQHPGQVWRLFLPVLS